MQTKFDELLEFPCIQNFKVMGEAHEELPAKVISRLQTIAPDDYSPTIKPSSKGNYHSLSLMMTGKVSTSDGFSTLIIRPL
jgi:putative lipoic acid-binding regulatory protein